ncbi:igLON family member 5 isoform X2 [Narcine bancroftii]|uniref:igLON family member 5 isoform X2 n=1 Tax=Narcine bancroftii TaxID=1343680 RepID=UPI00383148E8
MHRFCRLNVGLVSAFLLQGLLSRALELSEGVENITVSQGETASLSCDISGNVTRVAWLNRSSILYAGEDKWSMDRRVHLAMHSALQYRIDISSVSVYDEGPYTCSFQTQDQPHTLQIYLIVQVPARIVNISSDLTRNEGDSVTLLCLAVGRPEPLVSWRKIESNKEYLLNEGEILEITGVSRFQAGQYLCSSSNGLGRADTRRVQLTVNYAPEITDVRNVTVRNGHPAVLRCEAHSVPAAKFQWFKEEKRLSGAIEGLRIQQDRTRSLLMFLNVSQESYGNYTCVASNRLGAMNASMFLHGAGQDLFGPNPLHLQPVLLCS